MTVSIVRATPPPTDHLFTSRLFVADIAKLAEQLVMDDMPEDYFDGDAEDDSNVPAANRVIARAARLSCRERTAFFMPEKLGDTAIKPPRASARCAVRKARAAWSIELQGRLGARVVEWIDTGVGREKQVAVLMLTRGCPGGRPVLVVCFRGSKSRRDYTQTDVSARLIYHSSDIGRGGTKILHAQRSSHWRLPVATPG